MAGQDTYRINRFLLRFPEKETERLFSIYSFGYDRSAFQVMTIAAVIVNLILVWSDYVKTGLFTEPLLFRVSVSSIIFVGYLISRSLKSDNPEQLQSLALPHVMLFAFSYFIGMGMIKYPDYSFPNSIISVVFFVVAMGGLRFHNALIFLSVIVGSYYLFVFHIVPNAFWQSQSVAILVNAALGTAVSYLIERARRNTFIKNQIVSQQNDELESAGALKNKLFSILSHDLRGPVNKIIAMVDMLKKEHISPEEFRLHTNKVEWEMKNTAAFMENMLYWSKSLMNGFKISPGKIDMKTLVENNLTAWNSAAAEKRIEIKAALEPGIILLADEEMLNVCIRNLISNAIKFTPKGGTIGIECVEKDDWIELSITDTGIGIDSEKQREMFSIKTSSTPGTQGEKGTGIGLHLVKEFAERNGGQISCVSEPGKGSAFTLRFLKCVGGLPL